MEKKEIKGRLTYDKLFWLLFIGCIIGVVMEGVFCLIVKGQWESHVTSLIGQFNALYGVGAALFFALAALMKDKNIIVKILVITVVATVLELLVGILLEDALGMKAWDYSNSFMNYRGHICLLFSIGWGVAGWIFCLVFDRLDNLLSKLGGRKWHILCIVLSVFMLFNFAVTAVAVTRWSERHEGEPPSNKIESIMDEYTPDDYMQKRFIEWWFIDEGSKA